MRQVTTSSSSKLSRQLFHAFVVLALLSAIAWFDHDVDPALDLAVLYLIPITYAAWVFGHRGAIVTALASAVPTYTAQMQMVLHHVEKYDIAVANAIIGLLVCLFVAEITSRLARSNDDLRRASHDLEQLNTELSRVHARLSEDMTAGGVLQAALLSFEPPAVEGCTVGGTVKYSQMVGGDFMDAGILDGRFYVCVADIAGKGTAAALFTTLLKYLLEDARQIGLHDVALVSALHSSLKRLLPADRFVSLFYAEIDPLSRRMDYVNAGHPAGLVFRKASERIDALTYTAPILGTEGLSDGIGGSTQTLESGDALVLYTDGATESRTIGGKRIGEDLICELVRENAHLDAQTMADAICSRIESVTDPETRDDLTILCVKIEDSVDGQMRGI